MLSYGVEPHRIIFANPCKQLSHIKYAVAHDVDLMAFDNEMELQKVKELAPNSRYQFVCHDFDNIGLLQ